VGRWHAPIKSRRRFSVGDGRHCQRRSDHPADSDKESQPATGREPNRPTGQHRSSPTLSLSDEAATRCRRRCLAPVVRHRQPGRSRTRPHARRHRCVPTRRGDRVHRRHPLHRRNASHVARTHRQLASGLRHAPRTGSTHVRTRTRTCHRRCRRTPGRGLLAVCPRGSRASLRRRNDRRTGGRRYRAWAVRRVERAERIAVNVETIYRELDSTRPQPPQGSCSSGWRCGAGGISGRQRSRARPAQRTTRQSAPPNG
jgi:hypothetical protein